MLKNPGKGENFLKKNLTRREFLLGLLGLGLASLVTGYLKKIFSKKTEKELKRFKRKNVKERIRNFDFLKTKEKQIILGILEEIIYLENKNIIEFEPSEELTAKLECSLYFKDLANKEKTSIDIIRDLWKEKSRKFNKNYQSFAEDLIKDELINKKNIKFNNVEDFLRYLDLLHGIFISLLDVNKLYNRLFPEKERDLDVQLFEAIVLEELKNIKFTIPTIVSLLKILNEVGRISPDPSFNFQFLKFLLNRYGVNFLNCLPSLYDDLISFGPFNLTYYVIGDKSHSVNFIDQFSIGESLEKELFNFDKEELKNLPEDTKQLYLKFNELAKPIPNDIAKIRDYDHYKANLFLILYHLIYFIKHRDLDTEVKRKMLEILRSKKDSEIKNWLIQEIIVCLTTLHHRPADLVYFIKNIKSKLSNKKDFIEGKSYTLSARKHLKYIIENLSHLN